MKIVGISGALAGHKTSQMVFEVLRAAKLENPEIKSELVDLRDFEVEFMRGIPLAYYNNDTQEVVNKILTADCLVIGTPIYQSSISGSLKNLFDLMPESAFKGKIVGYITTAGSEKHFLVAEYHLRPIIQFLGGVVPSRNIFVHDSCFDEDSEIVDHDIKRRIRKLAKEIIELKGKKN